jgi:hypothetical protein
MLLPHHPASVPAVVPRLDLERSNYGFVGSKNENIDGRRPRRSKGREHPALIKAEEDKRLARRASESSLKRRSLRGRQGREDRQIPRHLAASSFECSVS